MNFISLYGECIILWSYVFWGHLYVRCVFSVDISCGVWFAVSRRLGNICRICKAKASTRSTTELWEPFICEEFSIWWQSLWPALSPIFWLQILIYLRVSYAIQLPLMCMLQGELPITLLVSVVYLYCHKLTILRSNLSALLATEPSYMRRH